MIRISHEDGSFVEIEGSMIKSRGNMSIFLEIVNSCETADKAYRYDNLYRIASELSSLASMRGDKEPEKIQGVNRFGDEAMYRKWHELDVALGNKDYECPAFKCNKT